jgi:hypothetical protein
MYKKFKKIKEKGRISQQSTASHGGELPTLKPNPPPRSQW